MSQNDTVSLTNKYKANREDLVSLVSKCQQRTFSEEVDYLEELGGNLRQILKGYLFNIGDRVFENLLAVNYDNGIKSAEVASREAQYGSGKLEEEKPKCKSTSASTN